MEKCLLMIMNGSSLDLSVIGILGIKTQRLLCDATVHHFNTIIPCSIPSAEMLTTLEFLIRITTLLLISAHDPGGQAQIMYCALQQESLHFCQHPAQTLAQSSKQKLELDTKFTIYSL